MPINNKIPEPSRNKTPYIEVINDSYVLMIPKSMDVTPPRHIIKARLNRNSLKWTTVMATRPYLNTRTNKPLETVEWSVYSFMEPV